jgi:hypothetical protein
MVVALIGGILLYACGMLTGWIACNWWHDD